VSRSTTESGRTSGDIPARWPTVPALSSRSVDWASFGLGAAASAVAGIVLWAVLPRGVVLKQSPKTRDAVGNPVYDTWEIVNDSHLPARISSVKALGADFDDPLKGVPLPWHGFPDEGIQLSLDDVAVEVARVEWQRAWSEVVLAPGAKATALVGTNTSLVIDYRRAGWVGVFERRSLTIHGCV